MTYTVVGINHRTAPIDVRELFHLDSVHQDLLLRTLKCDPCIAEAFVLSTCNRLEIHIYHIQSDNLKMKQQLIANAATVKGIKNPNKFEQYFYSFDADDAIHHLLKVVSGLDSMIIGENQILGQAKIAFEKSIAAGILGKYFHLLTAIAIRTGKKAQTHTEIGSGGLSVSWAAITTAQKALGNLHDKSLLIIGSGKMGALAADQIQGKRFKKLYIMNRTYEKALSFAEKYQAQAVPFSEINSVFPKIDICICAANAPHYVLDYAIMEQVCLRRNSNRIILIDISMPRNIDPRIGALPGVDHFDIDHLSKPISESLQKRQAAIADVQTIINQKYAEFCQKWQKNQDYHLINCQKNLNVSANFN